MEVVGVPSYSTHSLRDQKPPLCDSWMLVISYHVISFVHCGLNTFLGTELDPTTAGDRRLQKFSTGRCLCDPDLQIQWLHPLPSRLR